MAQVTIQIKDEVHTVAVALRRSYYQRDDLDLQDSKNPLMWIRMAEDALRAYQLLMTRVEDAR
ncbi:hypothetical protein SEA_SHAGRAT_69 [Rhodococcus phage Shagrat]|nr:hypothetical protein SEA_SHAGRAT_69 [Rhodococcus phage Shagrat]